MVTTQARWVRALALGVIASLVLLACTSTGQPTAAPSTPAPATGAPATDAPATDAPATDAPATDAPATDAPATDAPTEAPTEEPTPAGPTAGGTIYVLKADEGWTHVDPQRIYTGEDLAFFGATIMRSLTTYTTSRDPVEANGLQADLATDIGTPNAEFTSWSFTLKDGIRWQDGSDVVCEDVAYGVSRTFAQDIITDGPTFAIAFLDVEDYPGPYVATEEQQAAYDAAVSCDGNTITFNLNQPVSDFNYTVTLGMSAVPNPVDHPGVDTGETYTIQPWSNGPYMIEEYTQGVGGHMTLVRNPEWDAATDTFRLAYPDTWEINFLGPDTGPVIDQRLMASTGDDAMAVKYGNVQPENLQTIFVDATTPQPDFEGRAISDYDPYSYYYWINTSLVPELNHRLAMMAALDIGAIIQNAGGDFAGERGDGAIKPNIGGDYAPTDVWSASGPFGQEVPLNGDTALAQQLLEESGVEPPELTYDYPQSETNDRAAAIIQQSLEAAGFTVVLNPISPANTYYPTVMDPTLQNHFGSAGWGPDWPNASTVIGPLFTDTGGFNLSQITEENEPQWYADVAAARGEADRATQMGMWQELNRTASWNGWIIPYRFGLSQALAGNGLENTDYQWAPYGSWAYQELAVSQ